MSKPLDDIVATIPIPPTARPDERTTPGFEYQTLSDGQWYRSLSRTGTVADDFTGEHISTIPQKMDRCDGPQPTSAQLEATKAETFKAEIEAQLAAAQAAKAADDRREEALRNYRIARDPNRGLLRRKIDYTIHHLPAYVAPETKLPKVPAAKRDGVVAASQPSDVASQQSAQPRSHLVPPRKNA